MGTQREIPLQDVQHQLQSTGNGESGTTYWAIASKPLTIPSRFSRFWQATLHRAEQVRLPAGGCVAPTFAMSYTVFMDTTLTIRADERLRVALERRARTQGKSLSAVAREILEAAVREQPLGLKTAHLKGRVRLRRTQTDAWRKALADRNWRP